MIFLVLISLIAISFCYDVNDLVVAIAEGNCRLVKKLSKRVDINAHDAFGTTPLIYAIEMGMFNAVYFLLKNGADVNICDRNWDITPLHVCVRKKYRSLAEKLIRMDANVAAVNYAGSTVLHYLANYGDKHMTDLLFDYGGFYLLEAKDKEGYTPLLSALKTGNLEVIKELLDMDASVLAITEDGDTCLHFAAAIDSINLIDTLLAGGASEVVNVRNKRGDSPLMKALQANTFDQTRIADALVKAGADCTIANYEGNTTLHYVTGSEITKMMIAGNAVVNAANVHGATPLHSAVKNQRKRVAQQLLAAGADPGAMDEFSNTPLHARVVHWNPNLVRILLSAPGIMIDHENDDGDTPLMVSLKILSENKYLADKEDHIFDLLLKEGANPDIPNHMMDTPLIFAVRNGLHRQAIALILEGADPNVIDSIGDTPLLCSVKRKEFASVEVVNALLDARADIFARDNHNRVCTYYAFLNKLPRSITRRLFTTAMSERMVQESDGKLSFCRISQELTDGENVIN